MEGLVTSLNAAAAGTVMLYEALRQRRRDVPPAQTRTPRPEPVTAEPQTRSTEDAEPVVVGEVEPASDEADVVKPSAEAENTQLAEDSVPVQEKPKKPARRRSPKKSA